MLRMDYRRDETSIDRKIKQFLDEHGFDFKLAKSKVYCRSFFNHLGDEEKKVLLGFLSEFVQQPFVKIKVVTTESLKNMSPVCALVRR